MRWGEGEGGGRESIRHFGVPGLGWYGVGGREGGGGERVVIGKKRKRERAPPRVLGARGRSSDVSCPPLLVAEQVRVGYIERERRARYIFLSLSTFILGYTILNISKYIIRR